MCTAVRFADGEGNLYFGRNLDWSVSYGEKVVMTPKGFKPASPFGATPEVKFPIIGTAIVEEANPLYFDCGNDAGLAVAGLNFPGYAQYETAPVAGKTNISSWEFPLWVCATFSSVDEVEAALANAAIVDAPINDKYPTSQLHWIIGDATRSIVVEYTAQGMQVFHNDADVLANQPGYAWHAENLRNYLNVTPEVAPTTTIGATELAPYGSGGGMRGLPGDYYSPSRFVREAYFNAHYPAQVGERANVIRLFRELESVEMIDGAARMIDGDFERTIYTGGFSSATNTYYWTTYDNPAIRHVSLEAYPQAGDAVVVCDTLARQDDAW